MEDSIVSLGGSASVVLMRGQTDIARHMLENRSKSKAQMTPRTSKEHTFAEFKTHRQMSKCCTCKTVTGCMHSE